ncbi:VirB4 family type IV secretion system protein [Spiroplasma endosymbiont of Poecilobothrus nobilitatus]|uniref:VirB4 family type IV secretion system protein n=1 Tax=Spiroplasma endosymbiont of Poecilobothrus nobilitatus TaxID=1209220 RepID=UPI00313D7825
MVSVIFTCYGKTKEELNKIVNTCKNQLIKEQIKINLLKYQQLKFYFSIFKDNKKTKHVYQEMATVSIASSYPFVLPTTKDNGGLLLGANEHNSPVIFDVKHRDSFRNSSNVVVFGLTGSGKTMHVKKQLNWLYCNNAKLYIVDPERDYHSLANYYGGEIIPIGKSGRARINPLEVFGNDLLEHILLLEQWFKILYPTLQIRDVAEWQKTLLAVYKAKKITPKTDFTKLSAKDYPILTDLYNYNEKQEKDKEHKSTLNSVLWKLTQGADGYLWNGVSTLLLKSDLIVFDTHELTANKNRQNAQLFLMLAFLDKEVKKNKEKNETLPIAEQQWICIAIDESHLLINENNALALNFLFEMTKRIRKYNGILYIITQNIADFMGNANIKTQS